MRFDYSKSPFISAAKFSVISEPFTQKLNNKVREKILNQAIKITLTNNIRSYVRSKLLNEHRYHLRVLMKNLLKIWSEQHKVKRKLEHLFSLDLHSFDASALRTSSKINEKKTRNLLTIHLLQKHKRMLQFLKQFTGQLNKSR